LKWSGLGYVGKRCDAYFAAPMRMVL